MGKLYFELSDIDINVTDKEFLSLLRKFYLSQRTEKIYQDIMSYNIQQLSENKKSIFVLYAKKRFEYDLDKKDLSEILPFDSGVYTIEDVISGNVSS